VNLRGVTVTCGLVLLTICQTDSASAQSPAPAAAQPAAVPQAGKATPPQAPSGQASSAANSVLEPQGFNYSPEGRRDPFVSLLLRGSDSQRQPIGSRPAGLAGLGTADVALKGTLHGTSGYVAILQGADNRTYIVRAGDRLLDGTIRTISQNAMVILQEVNDPLSLEKAREVRKVLRQTEEAK
jgi:Tfp pilus assembly protein PilP